MNRRDFVVASLAAASASGAEEPIGAGFIGTGNRGSYLLRTTLNQAGVKVVAVCDIKPDRLDKAASAAARDQPATFNDYRRLLERKDVGAVFIASPCDLHVEMAIAALQAGKHVYCEKPAGITPESIGRLVEVAKASRTVYQVGQQMRADAKLQKTISKIREGVAGELIMAKAQRHAGEDLDHDGPSKDWFFDAKRSGDVIVEMAVHNLDECNWAIGSRPDRAGGFGGALLWKDDPPGRTNMDGYTLSYDYANGVKLSFTQIFFHPNRLPNGGQYLYVYGTTGAVDVGAGMYYPRARGSQPVPLLTPEEQKARPLDNAHIAGFLECIRTGSKPLADIEVGATAALTAIMGREAIYQKRVVSWQEFGVKL
jgi:predicted dehydrogenase